MGHRHARQPGSRGATSLGEIVWHASNEVMYLTRACLSWRIDGTLYTSPPPALLRALVPGRDCALVAPPRAKPDQWGEIHCSFPATLTFSADAENVATTLRDIELRAPCAAGEREAVPLLCNADRTLLRHSVLDTMLRNVLTHLYGAKVAALYSWHSYRSGLATALHAAGVPDATIMLICRWMCDASLHVYCRIGTAEHEVSINKAAGAHRLDPIGQCAGCLQRPAVR
uniref:Tyr recombinase domain-containing protein n=1 Tax=Coccolithus braarudii TaxID=221442 RepID=A0A7S0Q9S7_9EUKA|mmetsp:Transcript_50873/g.108665  ORF Transcript_50873/g.108665 Transcript_50873/m.108665 type:complete len:228 (+) Transcript_50873:212-895(+)